MSTCMKCGRKLVSDEISLHLKMINRSATEYMCLTCMAGFYNCEEELLLKKIEQFRETGCTLFVPRKTK